MRILATLILVFISAPSLAKGRHGPLPCWQVKLAAKTFGAANLEAWARTRYSEADIQEAKKCLLKG